jgi:hypothetical protein
MLWDYGILLLMFALYVIGYLFHENEFAKG